MAYGTMGGAERLWWLLRHFGHDACAVIDLASWRGPLRGGEEEIAKAAFAPRERSDDVISAEDLTARGTDLVIVDARTPNRFRGEPNPIDQPPGRRANLTLLCNEEHHREERCAVRCEHDLGRNCGYPTVVRWSTASAVIHV